MALIPKAPVNVLGLFDFLDAVRTEGVRFTVGHTPDLAWEPLRADVSADTVTAMLTQYVGRNHA